MSIVELGAIGEFLGAFAVVITLVYLGLQVRHNTTSTRAGTLAYATDAWSDYLQRQSVDDLNLLLGLSIEPDELSSAEFMRAYYLYRVMFRRMESDFYQYRSGILDADTWDAYVESWRGDVFITPGGRAMWKLQRDYFGPEFRSAFDDVEASTPRTPQHLRRRFAELWEAERPV
ncbi:MAG TPA: hypothetical protein VIS55_12805 [Pseudomonadales bacterium]|jgi:hypothetical protein